MVKDGYKQTEIGVIPEDWEIKNYDEVFNFLTTASYSRANLTDEDNIQYLHYGDIHTKYHFNLNFDRAILPTIPDNLLKKYPLLKDGDIIMADASEDYEGICKSVEIENIKNKRVISGLHTFLLRDKNHTFVNGFKAYISSNSIVRKQFNSQATGMKVFGVSKGNLKNILIPIPSKEEQKAIAKALSDTDELITSLEKLISKKEAIKHGTIQQLLTGKKRLSGFSGKWEEKTLEEIVENGGLVRGPFGGALKKEFFVSKGYKVYEQRNAIYKSIEIGSYYINEDKFQELKRFELSEGDLIISCSGTIGRIYEIPKNSPKGVINQALLKIKLDDKQINTKFFLYVFASNDFQSKIIDNSHGGAMPNLVGMDTFKKSTISMPNIEEQQAIAQILSDMDNEIETLKSKLSKTKAIKDGMMSELLTGKTRLKV